MSNYQSIIPIIPNWWKTLTGMIGKKCKIVFQWGFIPLTLYYGMQLTRRHQTWLMVLIPFPFGVPAP